MTELPTTFGKYYLTEKLATGGMAEIYLAKLIGPGGFEKSLVIKQIHPRLSGQRQFVDLFVAEAKILVGLTHGNIVPVYELGVVDDTYFIAMEYIDGPTLYRLTETMAGRGALMEPDVAAWITARIVEGLDYAHRKGEGVIHRDLSPRNVMLSRDGDVKLVDFGIAVTLGEPGESHRAQSAPTGSFPYMSPEQVRKEPLTGQTDLFSAGVLCWEMLTGQRLFARSDPDATLEAVRSGDIPRPSSLRPEIPARLDEVVMRALERDRAVRWASAGELLAALNRYLYSLDHTPGPRDVAALVGKFCPLETRRLSTHAEASAEAAAPGPSTAVIARPGPSTAVIPRDAAPQGKRPQRHQTFATNVALEGMLSRATPLLAIDAIRDEPPAETPEDRRGIVAPPLPVPGRNPPSRPVLVLLGLGGLALAAGAVYVFFEGRSQVLRADAAPREAAVADSAIPDAAPDVAIAIDAPPARPDAAVRVVPIDAAPLHPDSSVAAAPDASAALGTLKIGADPWGEIFVDGKPSGNTPRELSVAEGHHTVEVVFPGVTPPRRQTFAVDVTGGETKTVQADFH
jgi:serine/threonine-protein kinase